MTLCRSPFYEKFLCSQSEFSSSSFAVSFSQALGSWTFDLGSDRFDRTETCGYNSPDANVQHFTKYTYELKAESHATIVLSEPNVATIEGSGKKGTWTMVYDEGFEVKIDGKIVRESCLLFL